VVLSLLASMTTVRIYLCRDNPRTNGSYLHQHGRRLQVLQQLDWVLDPNLVPKLPISSSFSVRLFPLSGAPRNHNALVDSKAAVRSFMSAASVTLGGSLSVAVGPIGRTGEAGGSLNTNGQVAAM
jgi:hypothetical protein